MFVESWKQGTSSSNIWKETKKCFGRKSREAKILEYSSRKRSYVGQLRNWSHLWFRFQSYKRALHFEIPAARAMDHWCRMFFNSPDWPCLCHHSLDPLCPGRSDLFCPRVSKCSIPYFSIWFLLDKVDIRRQQSRMQEKRERRTAQGCLQTLTGGQRPMFLLWWQAYTWTQM